MRTGEEGMSNMGGGRAVGHVVVCGFIMIVWRAWLLGASIPVPPSGRVSKVPFSHEGRELN